MQSGTKFLIDSKEIGATDYSDFTYRGQQYWNISAYGYAVNWISVPYTWYSVRSTNNSFVFTEGAGNLTATITPGNYTAAQLVTELKTQLDAAGALTYTVSYSSSTGKLTISAGSNFTIESTDASFTAAFTGFTTDRSGASSYAADNVLQLTDRYILLKSNVAPNDYVENGLRDSIMAFIPVNVATNEVINYQPNSRQVNYFDPEGKSHSRINSIQFKLEHVDGEKVDLNGVPWTAELEFFK